MNNVGHVPFYRYNTLDEPALVARQEAVLRKLLTELNGFDNVYYEICDEPYCSGASPKETEAWQNHLLDVADATMRKLPHRQLLAVNFANEYTLVRELHPAVSILNFHYCSPPAAAEEYEIWHRNCLVDAAEWMARLWNHPSVIMWVLSNESWNDNAWEEGPFQAFVNALDPSRPTLRTGTTGTRDNYDVHWCGNITETDERNLQPPRILFAQLDLQRHVDRSRPNYDPAAERLLANLLINGKGQAHESISSP